MSKVGLVDWFIAGGWLQLGSLTSIVACQLMGTSQVYIVALLRWPAIYPYRLVAQKRTRFCENFN